MTVNKILPILVRDFSNTAVSTLTFVLTENAPIRQAPISRLEQRVAPDGHNLINVLHTLYE